MKLRIILFALFLTMGASLSAQTSKQTSGWLFLMNNTKINQNWGAYMDVQVRTPDQFDGVKNLLIRPGVTYYINKKSEATLGYLFNQTYSNPGEDVKTLTEQRIWEQYLYKHQLGSVNISHRFRLEQRFIERANQEDLFSQRFRYFFRVLVPLQKNKKTFEQGAYAALQNEFFLHLQNKDELNGYVFDQNRAYLAGGYRFSPKMDMELGYMNQSSKGAQRNSMNNIIQLAVYTRF